MCFGLPYVVVASRRQREPAGNDFEGRAGCGARETSFGSCVTETFMAAASRMTPERHDDVEDVVGRAGGDVPPEETHEPSLLVAFVEKNTARCVDSFEVGQVHSHPCA